MAAQGGYLTPRQKMINLMYIVLTAMLALNVSSDVLDGFTQVEEGLARSNNTMALRNDAIMGRLANFAEHNPGKGMAWFEKGVAVRLATDSILMAVDSLKLAIVVAADGKDGNPSKIDNREDTESASLIMLGPSGRGGEKLRRQVDAYRNFINSYITDPVKRASIDEVLSTEPTREKNSGVKRLWEEYKFENQPVVAAITLLSKLQNDIRFAEGEALATLLTNVDAGDMRVNQLDAFVIPNSRIVMRGQRYSADILLAAVDTTSRPTIYVGDKALPQGTAHYEFIPGQTGDFALTGRVEVAHDDGSVTEHTFRSDYSVIEPAATVSATMMNVLYAGIDNPLSISVPGATQNGIEASMTNGTISRSGSQWIARPTQASTEAVISVRGVKDGQSYPAGSITFKVRRLPDPKGYIRIGNERYNGDRPIAKSRLMETDGIGAAIDDGLLDIPFRVTSFETVFVDQMGNSMPERSDGPNFTARQKDKIRRLARGKRFYISRIRAAGPDGTERSLSPIEVIVN